MPINFGGDKIEYMTYTQQNLPLSPRKIIKKSIRAIIVLLFASFIFVMELPSVSIYGTNFALKLMFLSISLFPVIVCLLVILYQYLYYRFYSYNFSDDNAEITKGVIAKATGHVRYERLQNVYVDQDFWDRIFGLYDVHYETAGETSRFYSHVDGLLKENADILTNFLLGKTKFLAGRTSGAENLSSIPQSSQSSESVSQSISDISSSTHPISKRIVWAYTIPMAIIFDILSLLPLWGFANDVACKYVMRATCYARLLNYLLPLWVIFWALIFMFSYIYWRVWFKNFNYVLRQDHGEIKEKVFGQSLSYVYYNRIQNINIRQGILDRLLGIFTVIIETAGEQSSTKLRIPGLSSVSAEFIRNLLLDKSRQYRNSL